MKLRNHQESAEVGREQSSSVCSEYQEVYATETCCLYSIQTEMKSGFGIEENNYPQRKVYGFPTKDDLEYFQFQRKRLQIIINVNLDISGKDYQIEAIRNITENFTNSQRSFVGNSYRNGKNSYSC